MRAIGGVISGSFENNLKLTNENEAEKILEDEPVKTDRPERGVLLEKMECDNCWQTRQERQVTFDCK
jgi:hypothetical protein